MQLFCRGALLELPLLTGTWWERLFANDHTIVTLEQRVWIWRYIFLTAVVDVGIININDVFIALIKLQTTTLFIDHECFLGVVVLYLGRWQVLSLFFVYEESVTLVLDFIINRRNSLLKYLDGLIEVLLGHSYWLFLNLLHYGLIYHCQELLDETTILCLRLLS